MSSTTQDLLARVEARRALPSPAMQRALRRAAGVSLAEVAAALGVTRQAVSMWELGQRTPRGATLIAYTRLLRELRRAVAGTSETREAGSCPASEARADLYDDGQPGA